MVSRICFLFLAAVANSEKRTHTAYTRPMTLLPGEVTNDFHSLEIPEGPIAVSSFQAEVVELNEDGEYVSVCTDDAYLHHHVVGSMHHDNLKFANVWTPMKPPHSKLYKGVGFGAGTECRLTKQVFPEPYYFTTEKGEKSWWANVHIINTRNMRDTVAHHCLECPCTSEDIFDFKHLQLNHEKFDNFCNDQLLRENNTVCHIDTYYAGLRCCHDAEFCLEKEELENTMEQIKSTYYLRYTFEYDDITNSTQSLMLASCCDATGNQDFHGNIEYDILACENTKPEECVHKLVTHQTLGGPAISPFAGGGGKHYPEMDVDVVYIVGHQHRGGMGIKLFDGDELICESTPTYGTKKGEVGNELGYITKMSSCAFPTGLRYKSTHLFRIEALYNNTVSHTGVMSLLYISMAEAPKNEQIMQGRLGREDDDDIVDVDDDNIIVVVNGDEVNRSILYSMGCILVGTVCIVGFVSSLHAWRLSRRFSYTPI